jgi:hypothetical protein
MEYIKYLLSCLKICSHFRLDDLVTDPISVYVGVVYHYSMIIEFGHFASTQWS